MMHHVNLMQQRYDSLNVSFNSFSYHDQALPLNV